MAQSLSITEEKLRAGRSLEERFLAHTHLLERIVRISAIALLPQPFPRSFNTSQLLQCHTSHQANTTSNIESFIISTHSNEPNNTKSRDLQQ